jgi:3-hydroxyacyl-CoA dehydrogenase
MVERGDATAEDIDTAMELGAGYRTFHTYSH